MFLAPWAGIILMLTLLNIVITAPTHAPVLGRGSFRGLQKGGCYDKLNSTVVSTHTPDILSGITNLSISIEILNPGRTQLAIPAARPERRSSNWKLQRQAVLKQKQGGATKKGHGVKPRARF